MSDSLDPCGCCEGVSPLTPVLLDNRPGLAALAYRVGTHGSFKATMQSAIAQQPGLDALTSRDDADPSIALIDACATMLDVLAFYQERIANEGFLRTATERRSILELAREVGYELNPGVAASTYLAFTMEEAPGSPATTPIDTGTRVQSLPGPGEQPQTFETTQPITAHVAWNALRPQSSQPQTLKIKSGQLYLVAGNNQEIVAQRLYIAGTQTNLKAGDRLLVVSGSNALPILIKTVTVESDRSRTRLDLDVAAIGSTPLPAPPPTLNYDPPVMTGGTPNFAPLPFTKGNISTFVLSRRWRERDLATFLTANRWDGQELLKYVNAPAAGAATTSLLAFRSRVGFFGNNAPLYDILFPPASATRAGGNLTLRAASDETFGESRALLTSPSAGNLAQQSPIVKSTFDPDWDSGGGRSIWTDSLERYYSAGDIFDVYLERALPDVVRNSWTLFTSSTAGPIAYRVTEVGEASLADFGMSARATGLKLAKPNGAALTTADKIASFKFRRTTAHVQSEALPLDRLPIEEQVAQGTTALLLDRMVLELQAGQVVILSGEQADAPGVTRSEIVTLKEIIHFDGLTTLIFTSGLLWSYTRSTVTINANVALSTHGETKREVLGSGDAAQPLQKFLLKQAPLTYISAPTATGSASTLEVRVNDILWSEVSSLYSLTPRDRVYITRTGDDSKTTVQFGDGGSGARPPSGVENIVATYRVGTGLAGLVKAGQLSLLMTRPLGVKGVINPLAPTGAEDPESRDRARDNAPLTVLTLGRIVSLQDFEDFARAFAGIGKAQATWLWSGEHRLIYLTIAAANGDVVSPTSELYRNLTAAIDLARDPIQQVAIDSYTPIAFNVEAKILVRLGYLADKVKTAVTDALKQSFAFEQRGFGQAVTKSEVLAVIQAVAGVEAADLDALYLVGQAAIVNERLPVQTAHWDAAAFTPTPRPAELLTISRDGITLTEMTR
ncbi:MAG TPA: putative baseplate assembly protein [Herpetosiphonaceae bacterium]